MTCSTIIPPTNFPSEFSTSGKRHNIGKSETLSEFPEFDKSNSPLPLIMWLRPNFIFYSQGGFN